MKIAQNPSCTIENNHLACPESPITEADREESGPGASVSTEYVALVSKRKLTDWPLTIINTRGSSGVIRRELVWGPLGTFSPDCLESQTPETYNTGGSLSFSVVPCRPDMELGAA